jgi:hypothetical protein
VILSRSVGVFALLALLCVAALADGGKVESIGAFADQSASESVRKSLDSKGYRISLSDGAAYCDVWFRGSLPVKPKVDVSGAIYTEIPESTLVGVVTFPGPVKDYRGQAIKPGSYTLRYELHPTDGNHMGISVYRDFLLLTPVALDQNADQQFKFEELAKLSSKAAGTNHPTPWSLVSPEEQPSFPSVTETDMGHIVFAARIKTQAGAELPIAIVVKGIAEQ